MNADLNSKGPRFSQGYGSGCYGRIGSTYGKKLDSKSHLSEGSDLARFQSYHPDLESKIELFFTICIKLKKNQYDRIRIMFNRILNPGYT